MIEYSICLVLKSGKVIYSDPRLETMEVADRFHRNLILTLDETNTKGSVQIVRNKRAVIVPTLSIDYVEIITDLPEEPK